MARTFTCAAAAMLLALSLGGGSALAGEIAVASDDLAQLPADKQSELIAEMKKQGLLAGDDSVKNSATAEPQPGLGPKILIALVPAACKMIAAAKKQDELGKCAGKADAAAQEQCKTAVETKFGPIETVCGAIKLF